MTFGGTSAACTSSLPPFPRISPSCADQVLARDLPTRGIATFYGNHQWKGAQGVAGERHAVAFLRRYLG